MTILCVRFCLVETVSFVVDLKHVFFDGDSFLFLDVTMNVVHAVGPVERGAVSGDAMDGQGLSRYLVVRKHVKLERHIWDLIHPVHNRVARVVCNVELQALSHQPAGSKPWQQHAEGCLTVNNRLSPRIPIGLIRATQVR